MKHKKSLSLGLAAIGICLGLLACARPAATGAPFPPPGATLKSVTFDAKASWREKKAFYLALTLNDPYWKKRWWVEKAARLLHGGRPLSSADPVDELMKKTEPEIVKQLMGDPRFSDTVLDFNMYFLGFKLDSLHVPNGDYHPFVNDYGSAILSAQETLHGGDYLRLFDLTGPAFIQPLVNATPDANDPTEKDMKPDQIRKKRFGEFIADTRALVEFAEQNDTPEGTTAICKKLTDHITSASKTLLSVDLPVLLLVKGPNLDPDWYPKAIDICTDPKTTERAALVPSLRRILERNTAFLTEIEKFSSTVYNPRELKDFKPLDLTAATITDKWLEIGLEQTIALPNSSTNLNRKRASYILKHFFCDDLTPIGVENPSEHTSGPHGSETSCYACHYKLDPMAGFFRNYGAIFKDFSQQKQIIFDDQATADFATYVENWRAPRDSGRTWDVGYIRSVSALKDNSYGESIEDLSRIVREAPEAKRCLVKRLFEYFVAENQTLDAGYLNDLTEEFKKTAATNSTDALKQTIERLVLSNTFHQQNPDAKECYDHAPGERPADAPPCRVAFILQQNCVQCHSSEKAKGNLNLSQWTHLPDGTRAFPHLDRSGAQLPTAKTYADIIERLSATDPEDRMPYKKVMTAQDRQELYLWAQEMLKTAGGTP